MKVCSVMGTIPKKSPLYLPIEHTAKRYPTPHLYLEWEAHCILVSMSKLLVSVAQNRILNYIVRLFFCIVK